MFTIRVGKRKIKLLNWIIFILVLFFIIYLIGSVFFMIPVFTKSYNYKLVKENYEINNKVFFKNLWFTCKTTEEYKIKAENNFIYDALEKDLIKDGFKKRKQKLIRVNKSLGTCKNDRDLYKKNHSDNYVLFKLNGEKEKKVIYGNDYNDEYVTAKISDKVIKNVNIISNVNKNKIGKYLVTYTMNISKDYTQRLYRIVNVKDEEKPVIKIEGEKNLFLNYSEAYKEPGYTAVDNYDGNITNNVEVKNTVNSKKTGTYKITYKVKDSSNNVAIEQRIVTVKEQNKTVNKEEPKIQVKDGITYVNGVLIVNKTYSLPKNYNPKVNKTALKALKNMQADAKALGLDLKLVSGYRSYETQKKLYENYVLKDGVEKANTYSAKPGNSEHQTGLAFDIGKVDSSFANTDEAKWIEKNAHLYGFIVRYPKDKIDVTGYIYEPWHVRYLGVDLATKVWESNLTLEEYLGLK